MTKVKLLLVDDHALVLETLRERLARDARFTVAAAASNGEEAVAAAQRVQPDIVVMDVDMPGLSAFEAARRIFAISPASRIVFLSAYTYDQYIEQALSLGALAYIDKCDPPEALEQAIVDVSEGRACFSRQVRERIIFDEGGPRLGQPGRSRISTLTAREREVLVYIADGLAKKEIAGLLSLSLKTVEKHADNLMAKLDIHDRVTLTRFAVREGLVSV